MVKITCTLYIAVLTILTEHAFSYGKAVCMIIFILSRAMLKETFVSMGTFWEPFSGAASALIPQVYIGTDMGDKPVRCGHFALADIADVTCKYR